MFEWPKPAGGAIPVLSKKDLDLLVKQADEFLYDETPLFPLAYYNPPEQLDKEEKSDDNTGRHS